MVSREGKIVVTVDMMNAARVADRDLWSKWQSEVHPDDYDYLPYHWWLGLKLKQERSKHAHCAETVKQATSP